MDAASGKLKDEFRTVLAAAEELLNAAASEHGDQLYEVLDRAEEALSELERFQPGDPAVEIYRARLLERRGQTREALSQMRSAVQRRPSWRHLLQLADMEYRLGEIAAARDHLADLLVRSPGHYQGKTLLAHCLLELGIA